MWNKSLFIHKLRRETVPSRGWPQRSIPRHPNDRKIESPEDIKCKQNHVTYITQTQSRSRFRSSALATWQTTPSTLAPSCRSCWTVFWTFCSLRELTTMCAPSAANRRAMAKPILKRCEMWKRDKHVTHVWPISRGGNYGDFGRETWTHCSDHYFILLWLCAWVEIESKRSLEILEIALSATLITVALSSSL